jgi:fatty acid desaturase
MPSSIPQEHPAERVAHLPLVDRRHAIRLAIFVTLYAGAAAVLASFGGTTGWGVLVLAPLYVLAAASLHGISLFTHEAVHATLSRDARCNALLGAMCAWPVLQNFSAYRVLHLRHHAHLGEEGDPDHYPNYTRWSWLVFLMNWGRLLVGYPVYIVAIPILGWRQGTARERAGIVAEALAGGLLLTALLRLPGAWFLHGWLIPMLLINTFVNIRGMSQHTLLEAQHGDEVRGTRSILTNSVTSFFMCNENYHLEHHLRPGVPWYALPRVHREMREELVARGAPYIPSYFAFVREFIAASWRRSPLGRRE